MGEHPLAFCQIGERAQETPYGIRFEEIAVAKRLQGLIDGPLQGTLGRQSSETIVAGRVLVGRHRSELRLVIRRLDLPSQVGQRFMRCADQKAPHARVARDLQRK